MFAIEIETAVDNLGHVHLPAQYCALYGQQVRLIVLMDDNNTTQSIAQLSEPALAEVWNNADDAVYDQL
jgi:hypothetical protein